MRRSVADLQRTTIYESCTWRRCQRLQPASPGGRGRCLATTPIGRRGAVTSPGADLTLPMDARGARRPLDSTATAKLIRGEQAARQTSVEPGERGRQRCSVWQHASMTPNRMVYN